MKGAMASTTLQALYVGLYLDKNSVGVLGAVRVAREVQGGVRDGRKEALKGSSVRRNEDCIAKWTEKV